MIRLPLETELKLSESLRKMSAELAKLEDKLTEEQIFYAIKEAILSGDFQQLVQTGDISRTYDNQYTVTKTVDVVYIPYREAMRLEEELKRYKAIVHDILNEEQREQLAQKLLDQHTQ